VRGERLHVGFRARSRGNGFRARGQANRRSAGAIGAEVGTLAQMARAASLCSMREAPFRRETTRIWTFGGRCDRWPICHSLAEAI